MPRQDSVQIRIDFITDESKAYANILNDTKNLQKELKTAQKNGGDVNAVLQKIIDTGKGLNGVDLNRVIPSQLIQRANQLKVLIGPNGLIYAGHPERAALEKELKAINDQMAMMNSKTKGVGNAMTGMREIAAGVFLGGGILGFVQQAIGGIKALFTESVKTSSEFEQASIAFEVMLGSAAKGQKLIQEIQKLAAETPFQTDELIDYSKRLLAMGVSAEKVIPTMESLGNIAAGVGKEKLPQLVLAFGQVQAKTKLAGGELKQFVEAGVPLVAELAKSMKVAEADIFKMTETGKISFKDVEKAIFSMSAAGGKFENLMERQSKTLGGLWSTFKDNFTVNVLLPLGQGLSNLLKPLLQFAVGNQSAAQSVRVLQSEFNVQIETLKKGNISHENRVKLINTINEKYKDYLPNLLTEKSSIEQITIAQSAANAKFTERIALMGAQENLVKASAKLNELQAQELELAEKKEKINQGAYKMQRDLFTQEINLETSRKVVLNGIASQIQKNKTDQAEAQKSLERYTAAAIKAGVDISKMFGSPTAASGGVPSKAGDPKADAKAENDRLKRVKDALDIELKDKEIFYKREEVVNELALTKKTVTESDFNKKAIEIERDKYESLIKVYDTYQNAFGAKSEEFRNIEIKKLELQSKIIKANAELAPKNTQVTEGLPTLSATGVQQSTTGTGLDSLGNQEAGEIRLASVKFAKLIGMEQAFEVEKLRIRAEYAGKELDFALKNGETEKGQIAQLNRDKKAADDAYQAGLRKNEQRTADLKAELEKTKFGLASQTIELGIELLSKDEAARKKNAAAIKAFQVAQITIDGISEVAAIWRNASSNPINAIIPGAGAVIGAIQTALAVGRTIVGVRKVNAQKFAGGGFTGYGGMQDETGYAVRGVVHEGEYVIPKRIVENPSFAPTLSMIESSRLSGFAGGGYATTPTFTNFSAPVTNNTLSTRSLETKMDTYMAKIDNWASNLEVSLPIISLEKKMKEVNLDRVSSAT